MNYIVNLDFESILHSGKAKTLKYIFKQRKPFIDHILHKLILFYYQAKVHN